MLPLALGLRNEAGAFLLGGRGGGIRLDARVDHGVGRLVLNPFDELLAHLAAQIPWFVDKLAFGLSSIQAIVATSEESKKLAALLRDEDFAVTVTKGEGRNGMRDILLLHMKRKRIKEAIALIEDNSPGAVIVVNDSKVISGGYIVRK